MIELPTGKIRSLTPNQMTFPGAALLSWRGGPEGGCWARHEEQKRAQSADSGGTCLKTVTETMPRRSLRLRCQNGALSPTQHGDIKPVLDKHLDPIPDKHCGDLNDLNYPRHKHSGNIDPVCNHPNTPVTSTITILTSTRHKHEDDNLDPPRHEHQDDNPDYPDLDPVPDKHNLDDLDLDMNNVRSGSYRVNCLKPNGIYFQLPSDTLPHAVALLTNQILTVTPHPPAMLAAIMHELDDLGTYGCSEVSVQLCLFKDLFPTILPPELRACHQRAMARHPVPTYLDASYTLPLPHPDLLYGYSIWTAFTKAQQTAFERVHPENQSYIQATPEVSFPFFVVELKAAAGAGGNLWDAANQCAGGAAA